VGTGTLAGNTAGPEERVLADIGNARSAQRHGPDPRKQWRDSRTFADRRLPHRLADAATLTTEAIYDVTTNPDLQTKMLHQEDPHTWLPQLSAQYLQDERDRIENIQTIAEQTGGHAFFDTNDLRNALSVASEEGCTRLHPDLLTVEHKASRGAPEYQSRGGRKELPSHELSPELLCRSGEERVSK